MVRHVLAPVLWSAVVGTMDGAAPASSSSSSSAAVGKLTSAVADVATAVADAIDHPDFYKDAKQEWYGQCIKTGDDAGKYHFQWSTWALGASTRITPNKNGSTGWAWVLRASNGKKFDNQIRVHKCANNPCTADWPANSGKYGKFPPPLHVQACEAFAAVDATSSHDDQEPLPPPALPPPAEPPALLIVEQVQPQSSPESAKTLFCMKPAEPASAIPLDSAPQSRSESSGLTPERAAIHVAQLLLDLAREIRKPRAYTGYAVHSIKEIINELIN